MNVVTSSTFQASIASVGEGNDGWVDDEVNTIERPDVGHPPLDVQLHVIGDGDLVIGWRP